MSRITKQEVLQGIAEMHQGEWILRKDSPLYRREKGVDWADSMNRVKTILEKLVTGKSNVEVVDE